MNKLYSLLTALCICSVVSNLTASEGPQKSFFDLKTQNVMQNTAKNYAFMYGAIYGASGAICVAHDSRIPRVKNRFGSLGYLSWATVSSMPISAPIVFGKEIAFHKYQENRG